MYICLICLNLSYGYGICVNIKYMFCIINSAYHFFMYKQLFSIKLNDKNVKYIYLWVYVCVLLLGL